MTQDLGFRPGRRAFLAGAGGVLLAASGALGQHVFKELHELQPGEFTWHPERQPRGPVAVIVSLDEQRVHVYRGGVRIAVSTCSTGKPGHETPTGVFVVLQKDRDHRSSTYNNAPMPNTNRLTWDGIALHAGNLPGYPASHGCVRLPLRFSALLFEVTHLGTPVIIADSHSAPAEVVHPGLVLSGYAEAEFEEVLATLEDRKHPSDWALDDAHPITSLIASSYDAKLVVIENDRAVAEGRLLWDGDPLGAHVYVLTGAHDGARGMHWAALSYDGAGAEAMHDLRRVRTEPEFARDLKRHVHPGMLFVFTDLPLHPDRRSGRDFVIMS
ncbi:L,D-transpeptidase catalytic domain [Rhodovulum sp. ES.010]|uniref:L,D-transpeptidase n=1 Tax=Rhodovulum sp. ES.010 TaxID=1882821 RepID=UPI00092928C1|nr:L,D-transpeptidase [Rhodovulum sp. ES.010]SIO43795.1 L,D-transpeptidase catalytic domain [Rhodovulum sp. ES.010]SIO47748.1 L,D-transpeptidase catalytic domain [Rhodovulum sp. ES.010]